ncbi:19075_t:CDS:2, partial [Funneliformis geosporum]
CKFLFDGGLLILLDGKAILIFTREIRLIIESKTCLLEQLRSLSPGKLVRCLVESDDHVKKDVIVHFIKQQNSTLESGDIIGVLILDDFSQNIVRSSISLNVYWILKAVVIDSHYGDYDSATTESPTGSVESPLFFSMRRSSSISDLSYLIPKTKDEPFR